MIQEIRIAKYHHCSVDANLSSGTIDGGRSRFHPNADGRLQIFCNNSPGTWHVMGVTLAAGGSYRWSRDALCEVEEEKARDNLSYDKGGNR